MYFIENHDNYYSVCTIERTLTTCAHLADARAIADALNEREAMRAEVERLRGCMRSAATQLQMAKSLKVCKDIIAPYLFGHGLAPQEATR